MLLKLKVSNFAIIEDLEISFKDGLTVLTGETGAGKSLIIDCISLLLGERAATEMIRQGEDKAIVIGVFNNKGPLLEALLDKFDIPHIDDLITIKRTISSGKNIIKINDVNVSLGELKSITSLFADIHQQFDVVKLFNAENYLAMIDGFDFLKTKQYLDKYLEQYHLLKDEYNNYISLVKQIEQFTANQEQYEYDYQEIASLSLQEDEEKEIENQISLLENYDKIYALSMENKQLIDQDSLNDIYRLKENVQKLSQYQDEYVAFDQRINDLYYELEDLYDQIKKVSSSLEYDPSLLEKLIERSNAIKHLKNKHHKSFDELLAYQKQLEELLKHKEDYSLVVQERKDCFIKQYENTFNSALDLHKVRQSIAINVEKTIENTLNELALSCVFKIEVINQQSDDCYSLDIFNENGIDHVEFNIETNIGEGIKPLAKVVSGGELSRIMLAIKMIYIKARKIQTIIFDEIDTGISGDIANRVARKIKQLSYNHQVITITHLPQVASLSDHHVRISKVVNNNRTYATIKELSLDEKIYEIASLISTGKITDKQLEYAKEMILNDQ